LFHTTASPTTKVRFRNGTQGDYNNFYGAVKLYDDAKGDFEKSGLEEYFNNNGWTSEERKNFLTGAYMKRGGRLITKNKQGGQIMRLIPKNQNGGLIPSYQSGKSV